ncbi:universal stress protein [Schlesneria paludicola]|uniref:universal stress protein n=1 Tax=Schlesneria paludicola TaxID=360056 RepID=UPI00029B32CA|nr:universal stress protein [Schlesneria paludicola]
MKVEVKRILFPTDFSPPAQQALQYAMSLAERFQAELHVMHVIAPLPVTLPDATTSWTIPDSTQDILLEQTRRRLSELIGQKWAEQHRTILVADVGFAVDEIVRYAKQEDIDLIVVGTHGHSGFSRLLLGSVAEKLVRISDCPVLTIHPTGHQFVDEVGTATKG